MGLDITFHERVERVGDHATEWLEGGRSRSCLDLDHHRADFWPIGTFFCTERDFDEETRERGFHFVSTGNTADWSSSYSGYGVFRAALLHLVRPDLLNLPGEKVGDRHSMYYRLWDIEDETLFAGIPFIEMLDFGDNEGTYGPIVAKKLLADFRAHEHLLDDTYVAPYPNWTDQIPKMYRRYMEALTVVGPEGLVIYA